MRKKLSTCGLFICERIDKEKRERASVFILRWLISRKVNTIKRYRMLKEGTGIRDQ